MDVTISEKHYNISWFPNATVDYSLWDIDGDDMNLAGVFAGVLGAAGVIGMGSSPFAFGAGLAAAAFGTYASFDVSDPNNAHGIVYAGEICINRNNVASDPETIYSLSLHDQTSGDEEDEGAHAQNVALSKNDRFIKVGETKIYEVTIGACVGYRTGSWDEAGIWLLFKWPRTEQQNNDIYKVQVR